MAWRIAAAGACFALSCDTREPVRSRTPLETEIARALTARLGVPVTTRCTYLAAWPAACESVLADGTRLPIIVESAGGDWAWRIEGLVVQTAPVAAHVQRALARLRVAQTASCGAPVQIVAPGARIACALSGGGAAFVQVERDGSTSLELALDPGAAAARGEPLTPEREAELARRSHALSGVAEPAADDAEAE